MSKLPPELEKGRRYRRMFSPSDQMAIRRLRRQTGVQSRHDAAMGAAYVEAEDTITLVMHTDLDLVAKGLTSAGTVPPNESYRETVIRIERYFLSFIRDLRSVLSIVNNPQSGHQSLQEVDLFLKVGSFARLKETLAVAGFQISLLYDNLSLLELNLRQAFQSHQNSI